MGSWGRPWQEVLDIVDRTMHAISGVSDPEQLVDIYYDGVGDLIAIDDYVAISRRNIEPPFYFITRSSRFTEHFNPWTQRDKLPRFSGGLLGEIAITRGPMIIEDLPSRLQGDDPAWFYLQGFQSLISLPQYDHGETLNVTVFLFPAGTQVDRNMIPMLYWQSGLFGRGTQNLVLRNQLAEALAAMDRELQVVGDIQRSLLPAEIPKIPGFDLAAHYETSARAGGDYYDFFPLSAGGYGIFIADVSGHGTPAAVLMAITHAIAHSQPGTHAPPGALLAYLNNRLETAYTRDGTFVTAFYAVLDPVARTLTYSSAGHNPPRLVRAGAVQSLDKNGALPLGILADREYGQETIDLQSGDLLVLYTDGITEAMAPAADQALLAEHSLFGVERLDPILLENAEGNARECIERIRAAIGAFSQNSPPTDDRTLIALRVY